MIQGKEAELERILLADHPPLAPMVSREVKPAYWKGVQELVAEENSIGFPEFIEPGDMPYICLQAMERLDLLFAQGGDGFDQAVGEIRPRLEDVASQFAAVGTLLDHRKRGGLAPGLVDLAELARQQFAETGADTDTGEIVPSLSDRARAAIVSMARMVERNAHKFFKRKALWPAGALLPDFVEKRRLMESFGYVHPQGTLVRLKKSHGLE